MAPVRRLQTYLQTRRLMDSVTSPTLLLRFAGRKTPTTLHINVCSYIGTDRERKGAQENLFLYVCFRDGVELWG